MKIRGILAASTFAVLLAAGAASGADLDLYYGVDYQTSLQIVQTSPDGSKKTSTKWLDGSGFGMLDLRVWRLTDLGLDLRFTVDGFYGFPSQAVRKDFFRYRFREAYLTKSFGKSVSLTAGRFLNPLSTKSTYLNGASLRFRFSAATNRFIGFDLGGGVGDAK